MKNLLRTIVRSVVAVLVSLVALLCLPTTAGAAATGAEAAQFLDLINQERVSRGLPGLRMQTGLAGYAGFHAGRMRDRGSMWHDMTALKAAAPTGWLALGENVGQGSTVAGLHRAFMASDGHRQNILRQDYNYAGIGVALNSSGRMFVSVEFMRHPSTSLPVVTSGAPAAA